MLKKLKNIMLLYENFVSFNKCTILPIKHSSKNKIIPIIPNIIILFKIS